MLIFRHSSTVRASLALDTFPSPHGPALRPVVLRPVVSPHREGQEVSQVREGAQHHRCGLPCHLSLQAAPCDSQFSVPAFLAAGVLAGAGGGSCLPWPAPCIPHSSPWAAPCTPQTSSPSSMPPDIVSTPQEVGDTSTAASLSLTKVTNISISSVVIIDRLSAVSLQP